MLTNEGCYTDPIELYPEVLEIFNKLIETQNAGKATIFFELSGHRELLWVRVHAPTWSNISYADYDDEVYISPGRHIEVAKFKSELFAYLETL